MVETAVGFNWRIWTLGFYVVPEDQAVGVQIGPVSLWVGRPDAWEGVKEHLRNTKD